MSSSIVSSMLFFLLLVFSLHMDGAFGAQTKIRKLKETANTRRNLEGDDHRSSKMGVAGSRTTRCRGKIYKNMATTYRPENGQFRPLAGGYPCQPCNSSSLYCYTIRCTTTVRCQSLNGSPQKCTRSEKCERISGH